VCVCVCVCVYCVCHLDSGKRILIARDSAPGIYVHVVCVCVCVCVYATWTRGRRLPEFLRLEVCTHLHTHTHTHTYTYTHTHTHTHRSPGHGDAGSRNFYAWKSGVCCRHRHHSRGTPGMTFFSALGWARKNTCTFFLLPAPASFPVDSWC
jgi:hypothetical protein